MSAEAERARQMDQLANLQVLIADDNRQMRFLVRSILRAAGLHRVAEAEGGSEALDLMHRFPVDLVIIDWNMRPLDGIALTRRIRHDEDSPNHEVPIVMLTAHTERARVAAARDAGIHGLVRKPISTQLLLNRISAALTDLRPFIRTDCFYGPDRRRGVRTDYIGPRRRAGDKEEDAFLDDEDVAQRA